MNKASGKKKTQKQKPPLKVYFLSSSNAGIAFYRMWQFKEAFNRLGLASAVMPWFNTSQLHAQEWQWHVTDDPQVSARTGLINSMTKEADVVVVQYLHSWEALALVEALKACYPEKVFLMEIDDYLLETPTYNEAFLQYRPGQFLREIAVEQMKAVDGLIVSTPHLKEKYAEFNKHIYVVPNCLDFGLWDTVERFDPKGAVRIGWAGGGNHTEDLQTIEAPIKDYLGKTKGAELHVIHGIPDFFKDKSKIICHRPWHRVTKWPRALGKFGLQIGLAPLVDNDFNRAKSNLRKLEYAGLQIPVLAARVGEFARTVKHGRDGFLYDTPEEFSKYLDLLVRDADLRRKMGRYNYLDVKLNFNLDKVAADYVDILKECKARGQTTPVDVSDPKERGVKKWIVRPPEALSR